MCIDGGTDIISRRATRKKKATHFSPVPEFSFCNLTSHDEFLVQRQQLWVRQQNSLSQSKIRRRVLSRQKRCSSIAHDRGGARRRGSRGRQRRGRDYFRRCERRRGRHRSFWRLRRCNSSPNVGRSGQDATAAVAADDVGQFGLERLPLRIRHFLRRRCERKVVSCIVLDEAEFESDLRCAFFAAKECCLDVSMRARGLGVLAHRMRPGVVRALKGPFYRPETIVDGCL